MGPSLPVQTLTGYCSPCSPYWTFSTRPDPDWLLLPCWELPCNNLVPGAISHWVFSFQSLTGSAGIHQERAARNCLVRSKSNGRPAAQSGQGDVYLKTYAVCWAIVIHSISTIEIIVNKSHLNDGNVSAVRVHNRGVWGGGRKCNPFTVNEMNAASPTPPPTSQRPCV